ncbi:MAG: glycosyltransferase [Bacteroidota bacterium]
MLAILIPIYNFDVRTLVQTLQQQCSDAKIDFEIRCLDDGSTEYFKKGNRTLAHLDRVWYEELTQNVGRSAIRNLLAASTLQPYLLFMDCDSKVNHADYIQRYLERLDPQTLLYGGRTYAPHPPSDQAYYFHWHYGKKREQKPAEQRQKKAYHAFMTNNFLIPKSIFSQVGFEESLHQYGHEDTLFGLLLQEKGVPIVHLDNPLEHIGLESQAVFLKKSRLAIENLWQLAQTHPKIDTRLLQLYRQLHRWSLARIARMVYRLLFPIIKWQLKKSNTSLFTFDLYKLGLLLAMDQQKDGRN